MVQRFPFELPAAIAFVLIVSGPISYMTSSSISRLTLVGGFLAVLVLTIWANYRTPRKAALGMFLLVSLFFLLWRCQLLLPRFVEYTLYSRQYLFSQQYAESGHLAFGEVHSYFFLSALLLHCLRELTAISSLVSIYFLLLVGGVLAALVATLIFQAIRRRVNPDGKNRRARSILPSVVAFSSLSLAYSERSGVVEGFRALHVLLIPLAMFFLFDRGLKSRSYVVTLLLLAAAATFGSSDGCIVLSLFFLLFSICAKRKTTIVYSLIPISYLIYAAYSYTVLLGVYSRYALEGLLKFLDEILEGQLSLRLLPWNRVILQSPEDAMVASVTYLSFMILCAAIAFISTLLLVERKRERTSGNSDVHASILPSTAFLWIMLTVAATTFVGASIMPETSFSDVRTIAMFFPSLLLPFHFLSRRLIGKITSNRVLFTSIIALAILASIGTAYVVYPKSAYDPINVVEDPRLGTTAVFMAGRYLNDYYAWGGIIGDYKVLNRMGALLSPYETRSLSEAVLNESFSSYPQRSVLAYSIDGIKYPSMQHTRQAYDAAYSFRLAHNCLYHNGAVVIAAHRQQTVSR